MAMPPELAATVQRLVGEEGFKDRATLLQKLALRADGIEETAKATRATRQQQQQLMIRQRQAAEKGDAGAQCDLGVHHATGAHTHGRMFKRDAVWAGPVPYNCRRWLLGTEAGTDAGRSVVVRPANMLFP